MATDEQQPKPSWKQKWGPLVLKVAAGVFTAVLSALAGYFASPEKVVEKTVEVEKVVPVGGDGSDYAQTFGWHRDDAVIAENLNPGKTTQFADTPAGKAALADDADVYLWRALTKVTGREYTGWVNQGSVGCCVGCGFKHAIDVLLAVQIASGAREDFKPVSVEVIYGGSRVEVGGGRISGDGSVGAWAAKWCRDWGVVASERHGGIDLSVFSPARARDFGRRGCPDELEPLAKQHPVRSVALVRTWADVKRAVTQGYPVAVCSGVGFRMERDSTGRCRPQGSWAHCMMICGVRSGNNEGAFVLNSWGPAAHTGPVFPADAPTNGFWADADVIARMVSEGDSFALSSAAGFPPRKVEWDWFIKADRRVLQLSSIALVK
jgi:hypothetical protein